MAFQSFPISSDPVAFLSDETDRYTRRTIVNLLGCDANGQVFLRRRVQGVWGGWRNTGYVTTAEGVGAMFHLEDGPNWAARIFYVENQSKTILREGLIDLETLQKDRTYTCDSVRGSRPFVLPHGTGGPWADVFARGEDNHLWQRRKDALGTWGSWRNLGGDWRQAPSAIEFEEESLAARTVVFALGKDYHLWYMRSEGRYTLDEKWEDWKQIGGVLISSPAAVNTHDGLIHVFARGSDDRLWHQWGRPASHTWYGWQNLGCDLTSAPTAISPAPGQIELFWRGGDQMVWGRRWNGTVWNAAYRLGEDPSLPVLTIVPPEHYGDTVYLVGAPDGVRLNCDMIANAHLSSNACSVAMERGTTVTLELINQTGDFKAWAGDGAHAGSNRRCTLVLDRDKTVSVTYK